MNQSAAMGPSSGANRLSPRTKRALLACPILVTVVFALTSLVWLPSSNIHIAPANLSSSLRMVVVLACAWAAARFVVRRYAADPNPIAGFLRAFAEGLIAFVTAGAAFVPFAMFSGLFMYLASGTSAPLMDAELAALDAAIGFDWKVFLAWVNAMPWLSSLLVFAYHSTGPMVVLMFVYLGFTRQEARLFELLALLALTSLWTGFLMALVPAAGAYAWFQPTREEFSSFTELAGMWHYAELIALRSGEPFTYFSAKSSGMVTFPSFHTVLGVITSYAARDSRYLAPPVVTVNALMIVATIPEGGHYLVDVLAGLLIAGTCILFVRWLIARTERPLGSEGR